MNNYKKNRGFTLVEMMVALLIGLLIVLGAGQLYLTGFRNFNDIQSLSTRQAALTFASNVLVRDIARANLDEPCSPIAASEIALRVGGECHYYGLHYYSESNEFALRLKIGTEDWQPVVGGFRDLEGFSVTPNDLSEPSALSGFFEISFGLLGEPEEILFHAQNRSSLFN